MERKIVFKNSTVLTKDNKKNCYLYLFLFKNELESEKDKRDYIERNNFWYCTYFDNDGKITYDFDNNVNNLPMRKRIDFYFKHEYSANEKVIPDDLIRKMIEELQIYVRLCE